MRFSILTDDMDHCYICGRSPVHIHEIYYGSYKRKHSVRLGCCVPLCLDHHVGKHGVHYDHELDWRLKQECQREFEKRYGFIKFMETFHRNYL